MSFRGLPAFPCKGPGTVTQSSDAEIPANIRILAGIRLFLASVGFRCAHVRGMGRETQCSDAEIPGNIRILRRLMLFLASLGFRGLPGCPRKGAGPAYRSPNDSSQMEYSDSMRRYGILASVSFRELPRATGLPM